MEKILALFAFSAAVGIIQRLHPNLVPGGFAGYWTVAFIGTLTLFYVLNTLPLLWSGLRWSLGMGRFLVAQSMYKTALFAVEFQNAMVVSYHRTANRFSLLKWLMRRNDRLQRRLLELDAEVTELNRELRSVVKTWSPVSTGLITKSRTEPKSIPTGRGVDELHQLDFVDQSTVEKAPTSEERQAQL